MFDRKILSAIVIGAGWLIAVVAAQQPVPAPAAQAQQPGPQPVPAVLQNYKPVTAERLKKPEDGDWLMARRTYDGWGFSPLAQITTDNVKRLQPVWVFATGVPNGHEAPPIVNNGVMFVVTPGNQVIAIDAKTGVQQRMPKGDAGLESPLVAWSAEPSAVRKLKANRQIARVAMLLAVRRFENGDELRQAGAMLR